SKKKKRTLITMCSLYKEKKMKKFKFKKISKRNKIRIFKLVLTLLPFKFAGKILKVIKYL
ncbi:MAG: hypothetical protein Q4B52_07175, partial [Tissierellia bacterium]|nr:hypothetical protein [Tissierellia bacterium]